MAPITTSVLTGRCGPCCSIAAKFKMMGTLRSTASIAPDVIFSQYMVAPKMLLPQNESVVKLLKLPRNTKLIVKLLKSKIWC